MTTVQPCPIDVTPLSVGNTLRLRNRSIISGTMLRNICRCERVGYSLSSFHQKLIFVGYINFCSAKITVEQHYLINQYRVTVLKTL